MLYVFYLVFGLIIDKIEIVVVLVSIEIIDTNFKKLTFSIDRLDLLHCQFTIHMCFLSGCSL